MQQQSNRFLHVDALRAIAALLVVWRHAAEAFTHLHDAKPSLWFDIAAGLDFGVLGVILFFGISGYVIPASLREPNSLSRFAISRLFRLYPAFWLSILPGAYTSYWMWGFVFTQHDLLLNLTMIPELLEVKPAIGLYWTLYVEVVFYVLCAVLAAAGMLSQMSVLMFIAVFGVILNIGLAPAVAVPLYIAIMFYGAVLRSYHDRTGSSPAALIFLVVFGFALVCAWPAYAHFVPGGGASFDKAFPVSLGLGLFVLGTTVCKIRVRFLGWLGLCSYSIYLFHPVVFNLQLRWLTASPAVRAISDLPMGVHVMATMILTTMLAAAIYYLVELPMIRLGRQVAMRMESAPGVLAKP